MKGLMPCGCGQCINCRINKRREWTGRIMLESYKNEKSIFLTLTYDEEHIPANRSLDPNHVKDWIKRLRSELNGRKIRYYLVGEYGDRTERPHYHVALFGCDYADNDIINKTWNKGHTFIGGITPESASYVAGYVTKKMTKHDDPRLNGRHPEFSRMSLKKGIGFYALEDIVKAIDSDRGKSFLEKSKSTPWIVRHGRKLFPLGRYLKDKLKEKLINDLRYDKKKADEEIGKYMDGLQAMYKENAEKVDNEEKARYERSFPKKWRNRSYWYLKNKQIELNNKSKLSINKMKKVF